MRNLSGEEKCFLKELFGDRVCFDFRETRHYGHDIGTMPGIIGKLVGKSIPAAVVQPQSEEELVTLAVWAQENHIPLTPRGKATSGYGGVLPINGGIVVEFNRLNQVLEIDTDKRQVTVQGGAVWQNIEARLEEHGLTLQSYPTSAPASTVAGWLATGGAGLGSYNAGYFEDSVIEVRVVLPDGSIQTLWGEGLSLVAQASGITGFITAVTFKVVPVQTLSRGVFAFSESSSLAGFIQDVFAVSLPLWSLSFTNPENARYRNQMPVSSKHGQTGDTRIVLPEKFLLSVAYPSSAQIEKQLAELACKYGGDKLPDSIANHEWQERFNPMKAKRLGPSFIPSEVVIPVASLSSVLAQLVQKIHLPLLLEGFGVKGGEIVLLGFIPHDERKPGFTPAFGLSLSILKTALESGGRPYGCGLYFSSFAEDILGRSKLEKIRVFVAQHDLHRIMNPGKTIEVKPVSRLIRWGLPLEGMINLAGNRFHGNQAFESQPPNRALPGDLSWYSYACAQCGYCIDECPAYYGRGWESQSPRGKWNLLKMVANGETTLTQADTIDFLKCTTCETCMEKCQLELPIEPSWLKLRGNLVQDKGFHSLPAFHIMEASARKEKNIWAHYAKDRDKWLPEDIRNKLKERSEIVFFPGCTASYVEQDIAVSTARILDKAGIEFGYLGKEEACCGIPMLMAGKWEAFEEIMDHNIAAMKRKGAQTIITACPACRLIWDTYYRRWVEDRGEEYPFHARHYSEVIAEQIALGNFSPEVETKTRVTYHDPCHMGRCSGVYEEPRQLLKSIPGLELREMDFNRDKAHCCGSVLTLVDDPDIAAKIGKVRVDDALKTGAETLITACPCCRVQLRVTADYYGVENLKIRDLATFVAEACGMEVPDSTAEIDSSWAIFDIMIRMLTPRGMAEMMAEMMDDLIDAMPSPMGKMMKWIKTLPGGVKRPLIEIMKPVMPKMFPLLLPGMLPRVMPKMLTMVREKVPMPDFMAEQMPDLMPAAMVDLMPKMLPDIIPHFMPLMVEYLS